MPQTTQKEETKGTLKQQERDGNGSKIGIAVAIGGLRAVLRQHLSQAGQEHACRAPGVVACIGKGSPPPASSACISSAGAEASSVALYTSTPQ